MADVAAEMDALPLRFQQLRDDGRRRGLAVAAGNSNDFARAEREEQLHFGGYDAAAGLCGFKMRIERHESRRAENDVLMQIVNIRLPEAELHAHFEQLLPFALQCVKAALIAGCGVAAILGKQLYKRGVANADADNGNALDFNRVYVFRKRHNAPLF